MRGRQVQESGRAERDVPGGVRGAQAPPGEIAAVTMRDVPPAEWRTFLERFSREHRAWLATTHCIGPAAPVTRIRSKALESVALQRRALEHVVRLTFSGGQSLHARRPRAIRVERMESGAERALEIETADDTLVRLAFRATALPQHLDGVAPGEVTGEASIPR